MLWVVPRSTSNQPSSSGPLLIVTDPLLKNPSMSPSFAKAAEPLPCQSGLPNSFRSASAGVDDWVATPVRARLTS